MTTILIVIGIALLLVAIFGKRVFKRLGFVAKSKANEGVSRLEEKNAIPIIEQSVRELEQKVGAAIEGKAKIMGMSNQYEAESIKWKNKGDEYAKKAEKLAQKHENGELDEETFKNYLVKCLNEQENAYELSKTKAKKAEEQRNSAEKMGKEINKMTDIIKVTKEELQTLKSDKKVSELQKDVAKNMSSLNTDGTQALLDRLKNSVQSDKFEAEAYLEMSEDAKTTDEKIDDILSKDSPTADEDLYEKFMNSRKKSEE
jgi:phage shock protein A